MTERYHFIGIGGIGMSGLARLVAGKNVPVTGSDIASSYVTEGLIRLGVKVFIGHSAQHITPNATVVYTSDIKQDNPEYLEALRLKCPLMHRSDLLVKLMMPYKTLAVAGTHGKTTTSSLLTMVLKGCGFDPGFAVGGIIAELQMNGGPGKGEFFVAEADESDGTFLKYSPYGAIVTNIDFDHMPYFGSEQNLIESFHKFSKKVDSPSHFFWCGDDVRLRSLNLPGISYGFSSDCALKIVGYEQRAWRIFIDIEFRGKSYRQIEVSLIGKHNVLNASAVFGLAMTLGAKEDLVRNALANFTGVGRRCDKKGEINNVLLLDDYAHHPTEIRTTLEGLRSAVGKRRIIAVFQPHRYTRTKDCLGTYGDIFEPASEVIVTDIYGGSETPIPGLSYENVLSEIRQHGKPPCRYIPRKELGNILSNYLKPQDVVVTLGAGDITKLCAELIELLKNKTA